MIAVFLTPLLGPYQNFGYQQAVTFGYEKIKVLFFIFSISAVGFIWLFTKPKLKWDLIKIASLVFVLVLFVTSALGLDFRLSFLGQEPYFQGLVLYAYLFLFSLLVSSIAIKLEQVAIVLTSSAIVVSLVAIQSWIMLNIFNIPVQTYAGRVVSTFGQPNFYSGFLLLTLPFSYLLFKNSNKRLQYLGWGSGLLTFAGILVSFSRSTILMALLLLSLGLTFQLKIKFKMSVVVLGVVIISILIALKYQSGLVGNEVSKPIFTFNPDLTKESVEKRVYIWPQSAKIALQRPLTGFGLENVTWAFVNYFKDYKHPLFEANSKISPVLISLKELNIDRSHNYILDLLLFAGIAGFLSWGVLVFLMIRKNRSGVVFLGLVSYLIWIQFQNQSIVHLIYFWLLVGLINQDCSIDRKS